MSKVSHGHSGQVNMAFRLGVAEVFPARNLKITSVFGLESHG
ncbi:protein of unknown function [Maridesulfovibrio hydrothermalis AM13 = DSM 14728]|uniref:Uncharacterized protein n=1 Tax=Maridesulfovibrio hydrothermalis AM13 = DSM 14728 TaxID=1121451 RepID=L0R8C1_9BACT|nr:protein of unknown function [Maridesulfovibrio hydrothermalis AM13 = DSM 14728]